MQGSNVSITGAIFLYWGLKMWHSAKKEAEGLANIIISSCIETGKMAEFMGKDVGRLVINPICHECIWLEESRSTNLCLKQILPSGVMVVCMGWRKDINIFCLRFVIKISYILTWLFLSLLWTINHWILLFLLVSTVQYTANISVSIWQMDFSFTWFEHL